MSTSDNTCCSDDSCSAQDRVEQAYKLAQPVGTAYSLFWLVGKGLERGGVDFMLDAVVESSGTGDDRYLSAGQQALDEADGELLSDSMYIKHKVGGWRLALAACLGFGWLGWLVGWAGQPC